MNRKEGEKIREGKEGVEKTIKRIKR